MLNKLHSALGLSALVVLAVLAPSNGMHIKYSVDFPGASSGTVEYIATHAIQEASKTGRDAFTFGAGATGNLTAGHLAKSTRKLYLLQHAYSALAREFQLANKAEFRMKLGGYEDPLFNAFPPHSLGPSGVRDRVQFFKS